MHIWIFLEGPLLISSDVSLFPVGTRNIYKKKKNLELCIKLTKYVIILTIHNTHWDPEKLAICSTSTKEKIQFSLGACEKE